MREVADESWMDASNPGRETAGLSVRFEMYPQQNAEKTKAEGRPVFDDVEFIHIRILGDKDNDIHRPVRAEDKRRFAEAYRRWKATGSDEGASGTPLSEWPPVSRGQVETLRYHGIRTVEQLAQVSDGNMQGMGPMMGLRQKARDFLAAAKEGAPLTKMRDELASRDERIALLEQQLKDAVADLGTLKKKKTKED